MRIPIGLGVAAIAVVLLLLLSRGDDREISRGAPGFPVAGSLADDDELIGKAVDAWTAEDEERDGTFQVLWAGPWLGGRMVVLRHRETVASVVFRSRDSDGSVGDESLSDPVLERVVQVDRGLLIARDAPTRYTAVYETTDGDVKTKRVEARDRLLAQLGSPMALLADDDGSGRVPLIVVPNSGKASEVVVTAADLPAMRRALLESGNGIATITALESARQKRRLELSGRLARVLHVGPVPGGGTGVAALLESGDEAAIAFAWPQDDSYSGQQLAVLDASPSRPLLAAATAFSSNGPWLVVAGDDDVARIVIEVGRREIRREGAFALLRASELGGADGTELPPVSVRGYTAGGAVVPAAGL